MPADPKRVVLVLTEEERATASEMLYPLRNYPEAEAIRAKLAKAQTFDEAVEWVARALDMQGHYHGPPEERQWYAERDAREVLAALSDSGSGR